MSFPVLLLTLLPTVSRYSALATPLGLFVFFAAIAHVKVELKVLHVYVVESYSTKPDHVGLLGMEQEDSNYNPTCG
jgi:hypothetical protein